MGRPLLRPDLRRDWITSVYFRDTEYRAVLRVSLREGATLSQFIREAVKERLEREKENEATA